METREDVKAYLRGVSDGINLAMKSIDSAIDRNKEEAANAGVRVHNNIKREIVKKEAKRRGKSSPWTPEEDAELTDMYTDKSYIEIDDIVKHFKRPKANVYHRAGTILKLKRPKRTDKYEGLAHLNQKVE